MNLPACPAVEKRAPAGRSRLAALLVSTLIITAVNISAYPEMGLWRKSIHPVDHPANVAQLESFETFSQQTMAPIITFTDGSTTWAGLVSGITSSTNYWPTTHRARLLISIPMLPKYPEAGTTATLTAGATGTYDAYWRQVADRLITAGCGNNTLRIGWEFNGNWMKWTARSNPTAFANYWKRIVRALRTMPDGVTPKPGANFKFNWCGAGSDQGMNPGNAYPEDDAYGHYVDEIGADFYDASSRYDAEYYTWINDPAPTSSVLTKIYNRRVATFNAKVQYGSYPLQWWINFSVAKNKPLTFPEWGLAMDPPDPYGIGRGGDNPVFMQKFHELIMNPANNVGWHAYYMEDNSFKTQFFGVTPNPFPAATQKFVDLFTGRPIYPVFENPNNNITGVGGYGTRTAAVVGTDAGHAPFEGDHHYKITYTTNAGVQIGFPQQNVTNATHLSLAIKGPLTHSSQQIKVRLYAANGTFGPIITLPRTTAYEVIDIPLSTLGSGVALTQAKSLYFYGTTAPVGTSDTVYVDSIKFLQMTP
jgi:hypothetical protein